MSTLQEIKTAIAHLNAHDKALLAAELFAMNAEPDEAALEAALERGLKDVEAGRVRPVERGNRETGVRSKLLTFHSR
jgi:hypothetical protein